MKVDKVPHLISLIDLKVLRLEIDKLNLSDTGGFLINVTLINKLCKVDSLITISPDCVEL